MNTFTIEGWNKAPGASQSTPIAMLHFRVSDDAHLRLEKAEEELQQSGADDMMIDMDMSTMELETSSDCGELSDCQLRVYIGKSDHRGHFHLVGHRAEDGSLVYSNAVMVDQLG